MIMKQSDYVKLLLSKIPTSKQWCKNFTKFSNVEKFSDNFIKIFSFNIYFTY